METSNSILKNIEEIQESAMFQLSLSSMELFHSNFIYMLCRDSFKAKDQMSGIFNKFIGDKNLLIEGLPKREKLNFDLSFEFGKNDKITDVLIIENKVKAIATKEQLDRYVEKAKANYK
ncbi:PD-(D/E)XK nuclease family protein, partial [bacterium]|nr:PD-(D/E)XK nuclease family protein [bacterium]